VALPLLDFTTGFRTDFPADIQPWYQSADCTGPAYLAVSPIPAANAAVNGPAAAQIVTVPPATAPSIYFAGAPTAVLIMGSTRTNNCYPYGDYGGVGLLQSVPLSNLGLTLPFSLK